MEVDVDRWIIIGVHKGHHFVFSYVVLLFCTLLSLCFPPASPTIPKGGSHHPSLHKQRQICSVFVDCVVFLSKLLQARNVRRKKEDEIHKIEQAASAAVPGPAALRPPTTSPRHSATMSTTPLDPQPTASDPDDSDRPLTPSSVDDDKAEAFANLKDERSFEETKRRAQLVMGPPLGGPNGKENETVIPGQEIAENEAILQGLDDDETDLELTHLRIKTLRGLGLERFKLVEVRSGWGRVPGFGRDAGAR